MEEKLIKRERYLEKIRGFYNSDLIKVITGIRRCGKSVFLKNIISEIKEFSDNIIYINFEDRVSVGDIDNSDKLINFVLSKSKSKCYVFLDEVQMLSNWADAVKTLRLHNCSVFITGSNSSLLSSEFAKELSGRYVSFRLRPFVYREIDEFCKLLGKNCNLMDYLIWGGFPNRFLFNNETELRTYLEDLNETIIFKDLIERYKIRKIEIFRKLCDYALLSNSRIFSTKSIANYIKNELTECSINTIKSYIDNLKSAYIIESIPQYSLSVKRDLLYYFKLYNADVSFNSLRVTNSRYDITHNFENVVYNELIYMGYTLKVFKYNEKEIDFIATKNAKSHYVQVAYSVIDEKTYEREFALFKTLDNTKSKIIITNDDVDFSTGTVRHIKFKDLVYLEEL